MPGIKVRIRTSLASFILSLEEEATFGMLCGLISERLSVPECDFTIVQGGFPPTPLVMNTTDLISGCLASNETLNVQVKTPEIEAVDTPAKRKKKKMTAVEKSVAHARIEQVKAEMDRQKAHEMRASGRPTPRNAGVHTIYTSSSPKKRGRPAQGAAGDDDDEYRGSDEEDEDNRAASLTRLHVAKGVKSAPKRRTNMSLGGSEEDVSVSLLSALEGGSNKKKDRFLRAVYRRAVELQYNQSKAESRVAALESRKYSFETRGGEGGGDGTSKMTVVFSKSIHGRGNFSDDVDVLDAAKLTAVVGVVLASAQNDPDALEMLKPMNMAGCSPRTFWSLVRLHGPDIAQGLRTLLPQRDWAWLETGRRRTLSEKARAMAEQEGRSVDPPPGRPLGSSQSNPPVEAARDRPSESPSAATLPPPPQSERLVNTLVEHGVGTHRVLLALSYNSVPSGASAMALMHHAVTASGGDDLAVLKILSAVCCTEEVTTESSAAREDLQRVTAAIRAGMNASTAEGYTPDSWAQRQYTAQQLILGTIWYAVLHAITVKSVSQSDVDHFVSCDAAHAIIANKQMLKPGLLSAMATAPASIHVLLGGAVSSEDSDEVRERIASALGFMRDVREATGGATGWFDEAFLEYHAQVRREREEEEGMSGEEGENGGDSDDSSVEERNDLESLRELFCNDWKTAPQTASEFISFHLGTQVLISSDPEGDADASTWLPGVVIAHLPEARDSDDAELEALYKVEFTGCLEDGTPLGRRDLDIRELEMGMANYATHMDNLPPPLQRNEVTGTDPVSSD